MVIGHSSSMCLTDKISLQTHVTFCEYLVFHEFRSNLYITLAKYLEQEGISDLLFLTMPAYCVAANCNNSQAAQSIIMHELSRSRPAVRRKWVKFVQFKRADCCASVTPICVASTSLGAILSNLWQNAKWGLLQSGICRAVHRVTDLEKIQVRISKDEADEQQAHSVIPKIERCTDTLKQALTRQRQKV